jgi:hypothetical protein
VRVALLWIAAAAISALTMGRHLEPFDEGFLLQAATRMADGQWPYGDFGWPYGPGQPLLVAAAFDLFEPSVVWWRVLRVAADASIAVLVWALVRPDAGERWALASWLAAAVTIAQPTTANPFAGALALGLGAVLAAARGKPAAAGLLVALAAFWRPDLGAIAGLAALAAAAAAARGDAAGHGASSDPAESSGPAKSSGRPATRRAAGAVGALAAAAVAAAVLLFAPFAVAAGPGELWDSLVAEAAREGEWWRLPFPLSYDGPLRGWPPRALAEDLKDVLGYYLPLIGVVGAAGLALALAARRWRPGPAAAGLLVLAAGSLLYLVSRPDELHVQPLLVCLCALIPMAAARLAPRAAALALTGVLGLVLLAGAANRLSALLLPPELEPVHLAGVPGIRVPPAEAQALPRLAQRVQQLVPPGEPIYVAPRRSDLVTLTDPLIHFLVRRPNVLDRDVIVQSRPREQALIVAALRRTKPRVVVRWTDPISARPEPNLRGRPSGSRELDEYFAEAYRLDSRFGAYDVLVAR